jgi:hypothetical protein
MPDTQPTQTVPARPGNSPPSLAWEPISEDGEVAGVICPDA